MSGNNGRSLRMAGERVDALGKAVGGQDRRLKVRFGVDIGTMQGILGDRLMDSPTFPRPSWEDGHYHAQVEFVVQPVQDGMLLHVVNTTLSAGPLHVMVGTAVPEPLKSNIEKHAADAAQQQIEREVERFVQRQAKSIWKH